MGTKILAHPHEYSFLAFMVFKVLLYAICHLVLPVTLEDSGIIGVIIGGSQKLKEVVRDFPTPELLVLEPGLNF